MKKTLNIKGENAKKKVYEAVLRDDYTRKTYRERLPNKRAKILAKFLCRALSGFKSEHHIEFEKIFRNNGREFTTHSIKAKGHHKFEAVLKQMNIAHAYTRPYRPQTNDKVERFRRIWRDEFFSVHRFSGWNDYEREAKQYLYRHNYERRLGEIKY